MRRGFRRGMRRAFAAEVPPILQQASQLMGAGDYDSAAAAYEQLAQAAEGRNGPRAPIFFIHAGRARFLAGQSAQGMAHLKHGLDLFAARGQWGELHRAGQRAAQELNARGFEAEAREVESYLAASLPSAFTPPAVQAPARRPLLPTHCPFCGGTVRPDEVEWLDEVTAECSYCGSPVRGGD
ncbi:MAG: hypothetical protein HY869_08195 [Chloroflexi bacterium]|nr:hypothetical protein [Chloroflexota bacterium]